MGIFVTIVIIVGAWTIASKIVDFAEYLGRKR